MDEGGICKGVKNDGAQRIMNEMEKEKRGEWTEGKNCKGGE
jgi:hypothetical protein